MKHCSVCNEVLVAQEVVAAKGNTEVMDAAVEATCTETGLTEGKHCSVCNELLVAQEVVPAKGHTEVIDEAVEATCTETGLTEGKYCSVCDEVFVAQEVIPAKGHKAVVEAGKKPTCTESGLTEGKRCSVCGAVLSAQQTIPAKGHAYGAWTPEGGEEHLSACRRCAKKRTVACTLIEVSQPEPEDPEAPRPEPIRICPVCGRREVADALTPVQGVKAARVPGVALPGGNLVVIASEADEDGVRLVSVAFEDGGLLSQPEDQVIVRVPAALLEGFELLLIGQDGLEEPLACEIDPDDADMLRFTLDFLPDEQQPPIPALFLKRVPQA